MRTPKNQFALAKMDFSFTTCQQSLNLSESKKAYRLLLKIWDQAKLATQEEWYVLYVDHESKLICWHNFETMPIRMLIKMITGLANACDAFGIVVARNCVNRSEMESELITERFYEACNEANILLQDLITINKDSFRSHRADFRRSYPTQQFN